MLGAGTYWYISLLEIFWTFGEHVKFILFLKGSLIFKSYLQWSGKQVYGFYASKDYLGFCLAHTIWWIERLFFSECWRSALFSFETSV